MKQSSMKPLKEADLRRLATCACCRRKLGQCSVPILWRMNVESHGLRLPAVQRQSAFAEMLGSARLASVMGPDEDMTEPLGEPLEFMICHDCMTGPLASLMLIVGQ